MKVGILGGSFNPPHFGHLHISNLAIKKLGLNQVWWIPTKKNPLKEAKIYSTNKYLNCTNEFFIEWLKFDLLSSLCTNKPLTPYPNPKKYPGVKIKQYEFCSRSLSELTVMESIFYTVNLNGIRVKNIPNNNYLDNYFSAISLAHMIMGDGCWHKTHKTVYISTNCFNETDVERFAAFLDVKFGLVAKCNKSSNGPVLRFSQTKKNIDLLRLLVFPFIHPIFLYKLNLDLNHNPNSI